ncbi:hypothetical protein BDW02DRAFT_573541 [Decorospora gaudefroyi]|uniref:DUF6604 domain-containing protein n=1 Tax=Decorospora gaudefroyi TaxID=184978 RepID=A0A6A5JZW5_9PLEO|nr:hypothetical protein BDW02DRAFT_573541 [Decorospora gaudefroyi]
MEQYQSYKRCTKVALDWLWSSSVQTVDGGSCASSSRQGFKFKTTSDIVAAATTICGARTQVPLYVITALRDAIKHRWKVFNAFASTKREAGSDVGEHRAANERHKAFIMRLQKTLDILRPLEEKVAGRSRQNSVPNKIEQLNYFQPLNLVEEDAGGAEFSSDYTPDVDKAEAADPVKQLSEPLTVEDGFLGDDEFGEYCVLSFLMNELDTILETTNKYWSAAAKGEMPLPVAAWLTTVALHAVQRLFTRYHTFAPDYNVLVTKWFKHREMWGMRLRFKDVPALSTEEGPFFQGIALWYHGHLINNCRTLEEYAKIVPTAGSRQNALQLIPKPTAALDPLSYSDVYDNAMDKMQESMRLGCITSRGIAKLEPAEELQYACEPLLPLLNATLADVSEPVPLHLVFGYELLLSSFKTALWHDGIPNKQNFRLSALRLAMQVREAVEAALDSALFACSCNTCILRILRVGLQDTGTRLDAYIREVRFDLYYQAPWTAGSHMVEIISFAMFEGQNLCLSSGLVCALLHLYNALLHVTPPIPRVAALDRFCDTFHSEFFLGVRPKSHFPSHFRRAMGGKLAKTGQQRSDENRHSRIALPKTEQRVASVNKGVSLFYDMNSNAYGPTAEMWKVAYYRSEKKHLSSQEHRSMLLELHSAPFNVALGKLKDAVLCEFTGTLPVARLNFFAVHTYCAGIMRELNERLYKGTLHGADMVDVILNGIVDHLVDGTRKDFLEHWVPMKMMRQVFGELDVDESLERFVWDV